MKNINFPRLTLLAALVALLAAGCAKKPAPETPSAGEAPAAATAPRPGEGQAGRESGIRESRIAEAPIAGERVGQGAAADEATTPATDAAQSAADLQRIYFDYDQYTLTPEARQALEKNAAYMKQRPQALFVIEGHSDERGSDEYNLSLGERRAQAARDYLISLGVPANRLSVVSYGEERPLVQDATEESYAQNRRAEFVLR